MPAQLLLTDGLADQLANAVEQGVPVETAVRAAGISESQFYQWLQVPTRGTWPDGSPVSSASLRVITRFAELIGRAEAAFEAKRITAIAQAAESVNAKTGIPEWRAGAWLLNNHPRYRSTYRPEQVVKQEQSGTVVHEHKLVRDLAESGGIEALEQARAQLLQQHPALSAPDV